MRSTAHDASNSPRRRLLRRGHHPPWLGDRLRPPGSRPRPRTAPHHDPSVRPDTAPLQPYWTRRCVSQERLAERERWRRKPSSGVLLTFSLSSRVEGTPCAAHARPVCKVQGKGTRGMELQLVLRSVAAHARTGMRASSSYHCDRLKHVSKAVEPHVQIASTQPTHFLEREDTHFLVT